MYYVRKNLFNVIFVFDPSTDDGLRMAAMSEQILGNQMPVRVGIALVLDPATDTMHADSTDNHDFELDTLELGDHFQCAAPTAAQAGAEQKPVSLGESVIRLYRYVRRKFDNRKGLQFLTTLYQVYQVSIQVSVSVMARKNFVET